LHLLGVARIAGLGLLMRSITALDNDPQRALASHRAQRDTPHMPDVLLFP